MSDRAKDRVVRDWDLHVVNTNICGSAFNAVATSAAWYGLDFATLVKPVADCVVIDANEMTLENYLTRKYLQAFVASRGVPYTVWVKATRSVVSEGHPAGAACAVTARRKAIFKAA